MILDTRPETIGLLPFSTPSVRAAIHEAKYHGSARAFDLLALALAEYLHDADDVPKTRFDLGNSNVRSNLVLVPVPLGNVRRKERGFNQIEEITNRAAKLLGGAPIDASLLERTCETISQVSLPRRAREENMRGAFRATRRANSLCTYIVIDDVITTGATLQPPLMHSPPPAPNTSFRSLSRIKFDIVAQYGWVA